MLQYNLVDLLEEVIRISPIVFTKYSISDHWLRQRVVVLSGVSIHAVSPLQPKYRRKMRKHDWASQWV